ncbi:MAG: L,D-transpeptidase family protein [Sulfurimonas sp.]|nr:L,D-transpeptidase family protein [Sulfurimonas sp.]
MVKTFLILISLQIFAYSSEQIILVVSDGFNSPKARLSCFEDGKKVFDTIDVNIGKNGLGWGLGKTELTQKILEPLKYEGDKKAPVGIFKLTHIFGYEKDLKFKMPYLHATKDLICVDDSNSKFYNQIISSPKTKPQSFEYMKRDDKQYELGIVVAHNTDQVKKRGSCIFLHVEKFKDSSTAGCTSMKLKNIKQIINWLDINKNPILIQIPKSKLPQILELYPQLKQ